MAGWVSSADFARKSGCRLSIAGRPVRRTIGAGTVPLAITGRTTMRFVITARRDDTKATTDAPFDEKLFAAYMKFNEDMHTAGVLVASEGLIPGSPGARVAVSGGRRKVVDGPFTESKELVGGFYVVDVPSLEEAKAWALRCPVGLGTDDVLEIRRLTGSEDVPRELLDLAASVAPIWTASFTRGK
jgi:hypothetical protein